MALKGIKCKLLTWDDIYNYAIAAGDKVKQDGFRPEVIVGISRGGWVHARIQSDYLGVKQLYTIKVAHWGVTATITGNAELQIPLVGDVKGKKVLVVDDITDTGDSLSLGAKHVMEKGAAEVRTATLQHINGSKFVPNYFGEEVEWSWFVYPWNFFEDMVSLIGKIFEGEKTDTLKDDEVKKLLKEYNGITISEERFNRVKDHLNWLGTYQIKNGLWKKI